MPGLDAQMCLKHGKYMMFLIGSTFLTFSLSRLDLSDFWEAFWRPGDYIFGVLGHHFDASLLIQGHWRHSTGHLGAQTLIFVDF